METGGDKVPGSTIINVIRRLAKEAPDKEAFVFIDKYDNRYALSRQDLWDKCQKCAAILKRHGIEKGDVICNTLVNSPEWIITAYGTITAGAITMHGQLLLATGDDLRHNLKTSQCKAIIMDEGKKNVLSFLEQISYKDEVTGEIRYKDLPYLTTVIKLKVYSEEKDYLTSGWLYDLKDEKEAFVEETVQADDVAAIFNTSGTTGFSKLVPHTHRRLLPSGKSFKSRWKVRNEDIYYNNRSLGWYGGFPHVFNSSGSKTVLTSYAHGIPENMASHMINVFEQEKCDHANLAGIEVERILEKLEKPLSKVMKSIIVGGGPVASFIERAFEGMTHSIFIAYGSTESGLISATVVNRNTIFIDYCTGKVGEDVEIKIVDGNFDQVCEGRHGEIIVRSPKVGVQYLNDPIKTKESFLEGGWFKTGDVGYQDKQGHLYVLGRKSNAIMKGSYILYPGWLETRILSCQGIQSIAIIGVPDRVLHEDICVCIVKQSDGNLTEAAVQDFCQKLFLTAERDEIVPMPRYFLFFDEFPFNTNLKLDRAALRVEACKRLGIHL